MRQDFYNYKQKILKSLLEQDLKVNKPVVSPTQKNITGLKPSIDSKPGVVLQLDLPPDYIPIDEFVDSNTGFNQIIQQYKDILEGPPFYINTDGLLGQLPYQMFGFFQALLINAIRLYEQYGESLLSKGARRVTSTGPITAQGEARQYILMITRIIRGIQTKNYDLMLQGLQKMLKDLENQTEYAVLITRGSEKRYREDSVDFYRYLILNMLFDNDPSDNPSLAQLLKRLDKQGIEFGGETTPMSIVLDSVTNYFVAQSELQKLSDVVEGLGIELQYGQIQDLITRLNEMGPDYVDLATMIQQAYETLSQYAVSVYQIGNLIDNYEGIFEDNPAFDQITQIFELVAYFLAMYNFPVY